MRNIFIIFVKRCMSNNGLLLDMNFPLRYIPFLWLYLFRTSSNLNCSTYGMAIDICWVSWVGTTLKLSVNTGEVWRLIEKVNFHYVLIPKKKRYQLKFFSFQINLKTILPVSIVTICMCKWLFLDDWKIPGNWYTRCR